MVGGIFYHNYPGGTGLTSGAVFGKLAGTSAAADLQALAKSPCFSPPLGKHYALKKSDATANATLELPKLKVRASSYRAPVWLPGGHLQTLYPALCAPRPKVHYRRERWDTPDGDFIDLDWLETGHSGACDPPAGPDSSLSMLRLMEDRSSQISVLPVVDEQRSCVGLIRLHDIVRSGL